MNTYKSVWPKASPAGFDRAWSRRVAAGSPCPSHQTHSAVNDVNRITGSPSSALLSERIVTLCASNPVPCCPGATELHGMQWQGT
jgi:hypothetical protein